MQTAKLFSNGGSQAVRMPKKYRFDGTEVYITKVGDMVILISKDDPWLPLLQSLDIFTKDYMQERIQPKQDIRSVVQ